MSPRTRRNPCCSPRATSCLSRPRTSSTGPCSFEDDKIVEIGDFEHLRALHPDEPVRDFGLAALMPGFVDLHTHLEYSAMRGLVDDLPYSEWKLQLMQKERQFTSQDWDDSALLGALEAAQSGITTVADITHTGASGHAAQATGLRALIYREVATMDKYAGRAGDAARRRGHRGVARDERPEPHHDRHRAARALLVPPRALPARRRRSPRTARRSRSTSPAASRSSTS